MDPRHPRENSYPCHPRHFFDQRQNFIDPRKPRNLADPFPKYYDNLIMDKRGCFIFKKIFGNKMNVLYK